MGLIRLLKGYEWNGHGDHNLCFSAASSPVLGQCLGSDSALWQSTACNWQLVLITRAKGIGSFCGSLGFCLISPVDPFWIT